MILFLDEERPYLHWVTHHHDGFVLDCLRHPTKRHLTLHRATCPEIKHSASKHTHWTTGRHMKGCSLDLSEIKVWTIEQIESKPSGCPQCDPESRGKCQVHLTRLDRNMLSFVLEIATSHLDDNDFDYGLTVGMIARCFNKTEGQLTASLLRLVSSDLIAIAGKMKPQAALPFNNRVTPTAKALRTMSQYARSSDRQIERELRKLALRHVAR